MLLAFKARKQTTKMLYTASLNTFFLKVINVIRTGHVTELIMR
jgi:hypothetical protein